MGRINISDIVDHCASYENGKAVYDVIVARLLAGECVVLSFEGITSVSTSFVNAAFIELLGSMDFAVIKRQLSFSNTNKIINDTIKRRFAFEVQRLKQDVA